MNIAIEKHITGFLSVFIILFIVMMIGGLAVIFDSLSGPTCSLQTREVRVGERATMLQVIHEDSLGTDDLPVDFLVQTMKDLNPYINPGELHSSTRLIVPDECKSK